MSITLHSIKISGPYPVDILLDFHLEARVNEHAHAFYRGNISKLFAISAIEEQRKGAVVLEHADSGNKTIFKGCPLSVKVTEKTGLFYLDVFCVSYTYFLDIKGNSRSFQNADDKYAQILETVYEAADNASIVTTTGAQKSIDAPIFQYEETDWQFTLRMAGRVGTVVIPNFKTTVAQICFGIPKRKTIGQAKPGVKYEVGRDTSRYMRQIDVFPDTTHDDFYHMSIKDVGQYDLGDSISIADKQMVVMEKIMQLDGGIIKSDYVLGKERGFAAPFIHNTDLHGLSLSGMVLDTKEELVKLHFDIDREQEKNTAYWFSFVPEQGNVMYCMPQIGTKAVLKFRSESDDSGVIIHTYRNNGEECDEMCDFNKRYFTTEFAKRLAMLPDTLFYIGGSNLAELNDKAGERFETEKRVKVQSDDDIKIYSKKKVTIDSPEHIYLTMPGTESVVDMSGGEINVMSDGTVIHATGKGDAPYPEFDATPSMTMDRKLALLVAGTVPVVAKTNM